MRRLLELLGAGGRPRVALALQNLKQLFSLVGPFAPPLASEEQELLKEIDMELYRDLLAKLQQALQPAVQPAAAAPPPGPTAVAMAQAPAVAPPATGVPPQLVGSTEGQPGGLPDGPDS